MTVSAYDAAKIGQILGVTASTVKNIASSEDANALPVQPDGGSTSRPLSSWLAGLGRSDTPTKKAFWSDVDGTATNSWRFRDRVFIGEAVNCNDKRITGGVRPAWGQYASWAPRDSDLAVMSSRGALAISGMSRTSDAVGLSPMVSTWGIGGLTIVDASGSTARAIYGDVQMESGASVGYGIEVVVKNKGTSSTTTPYFSTTGTFGIVLSAGGDPSYGGTATAPCNAALHIRGNGQANSANYKWNRGIVFDAYGLTGTDGDGSGTAIAIELAAGQMIEWRTPGNNQAAYMYSAVTSGSRDVGILFANDSVRLRGNGGVFIFRAENVTGAVNYLQVNNATTGNVPTLSAQGSDTDIDIALTPLGAGKLKFGTHTAIGAETLSGYILIKDSSGTLRKIGVIS